MAIFFGLLSFMGERVILKSDSAILSRIFSYIAPMIKAGFIAALSSGGSSLSAFLKKCLARKCIMRKSSLLFGLRLGSDKSPLSTPKNSSSRKGM